MPASDPEPPSLKTRCLLIGNSRWHWAEMAANGLRCWHEAPVAGLATARRLAPLAWAAVGPVPAGAVLDPANRLSCADVPLRDLPPWLGIDRALAGWQAWREEPNRPVLEIGRAHV